MTESFSKIEDKREEKPNGFSVFSFYFDIFLLIVSFFALGFDFLNLIEPAIMTAILVIIAIFNLSPVLVRALKSLWHRKLTIDLLASVALIVALLNKEWHSAVFISMMLASARIFLNYTDAKSRKSIKSLLKLRPAKVHLKIHGEIVDVETGKVKVGDSVLVEAGERVPVDGIIESGEGSIDQSSLTGESEPVNKTKGDHIFSSTLNVSGSFIIKAIKVGEDTTFAKIIDLIEESQSAKAPISSSAEKFATWYIIATLFLASLIYFFSHDLALILSVLLVTCADDLAVAVPLSFTAAINAAARKGIIVKGGTFIEGFPKIKAFVFDKTGTITSGKPKINHITTFDGQSEKEFLFLLGSLEAESQHPTAKAVMKFIREKNIEISGVDNLYERPGYGSKGTIKNEPIIVGKINFLEENGIKFSKDELDIIDKEIAEGHSVTVLGLKKKALGFVSFSDAIRPQASNVIDHLKKHGAERLIMLTGDNEKVAEGIAKEVHIPEYKANLLPEDKINFLKGIIKPNYKVAMVGDGVNDAPSLGLADIGIAMGSVGMDAAIESADIVLMKDKLVNLLEMSDLSRYTLKVIRQDFWIWGISNAVGLALVFSGVIGPSGAAAFNFLTDFLPLLNSLKLFRLRFKNFG